MAYVDKLFLNQGRGKGSLLTMRQHSQQNGVVLPVALFLLLGATLLTIGMVRSNTLSLKIGGSSVIATETQAVAEWGGGQFLGANPINHTVMQGRYMRNNTQSRCGTAAELAGDSSLFFDCKKPLSGHGLPTGITLADFNPQRLDCSPPPRSSKVYQANTVFNNVLVESNSRNTYFGSEGRVGMGVIALVTICPED